MKQARALHRVRGLRAGTEGSCRGADGGPAQGVVRRGDQQQGLCVGREAAAAVEEHLLDPLGERELLGQLSCAVQLF